MLRTHRLVLLLAIVALVSATACSNLLGIEDLGSATPPGDGGGSDGPPPPPPDVMPGAVTFSGMIVIFDSNGMQLPAAGAKVDVLEAMSGSVVGSTQADPQGTYSVTWNQTGTLDVFLFVTQPMALNTFMYFSTLQGASNPNLSFTMFTQQGIQSVAQLVGVMQQQALGTALVLAEDQNGLPVKAAMVSAKPQGQVFYTDQTGMPVDAAATNELGMAWVFNAGNPTDIMILPPPGVSGTASYPLDVPPMSVSYLPLRLQ